MCPYKIFHTAAIINETPCHHMNYTSTTIHIFIKSKVDSNPIPLQPLFCPVYALAFPLAVYQHFDKYK